MRVVHSEATLIHSVNVTRAEALAAFGNDQVYMEKFLEKPRHIEFQCSPTTTATHLPRRARLLHAAPSPEGGRGGPAPGSQPSSVGP